MNVPRRIFARMQRKTFEDLTPEHMSYAFLRSDIRI